MWKMGDKVKFVENGYDDSTTDEGFVIGDIYEIVDRRDDSESSMGAEYRDEDGYEYAVRHPRSNAIWWIEINSFRKVPKRKKPKSEADVLDLIKENFRYGY